MTKTKVIALSGILAALAIVIMWLGGLFPFMTYVCPVVCICMTQLVLMLCGIKTAWTWYAAVSILGVLLCPDKEASAVYLVLGFYPIIKLYFDKCRFKWILKLVYFNSVILALYWILMYVIGMEQLIQDFISLGLIMTVVTLLLGNVVFIMVDFILNRISRKLK